MKKFLGVLILMIAVQFAKSQCTAFLGPDKQYMPCSNPFASSVKIVLRLRVLPAQILTVVSFKNAGRS